MKIIKWFYFVLIINIRNAKLRNITVAMLVDYNNQTMNMHAALAITHVVILSL